MSCITISLFLFQVRPVSANTVLSVRTEELYVHTLGKKDMEDEFPVNDYLVNNFILTVVLQWLHSDIIRSVPKVNVKLGTVYSAN